MSIQIIKRKDGEKSEIETIQRVQKDNPQISYNSEGRISIRIPQHNGDVLMVLDRPMSREIIRFIKNGIQENPLNQSWCEECGKAFDLPF